MLTLLYTVAYFSFLPVRFYVEFQRTHNKADGAFLCFLVQHCRMIALQEATVLQFGDVNVADHECRSFCCHLPMVAYRLTIGRRMKSRGWSGDGEGMGTEERLKFLTHLGRYKYMTYV